MSCRADNESPLSEGMLTLMGAPVVPMGGSWSIKQLQLAFGFFGQRASGPSLSMHREKCTGPSTCTLSVGCCADNESPLSEGMLTLMGAPVVPMGGSWSIKQLQLAFGFFGLVLLQSYTANLAAMLTVQPLSHVATSFESFATLPYAPGSLLCDIDSAAQQLPAHWSIKQLQLAFGFFGLVLLQSYTANLTAMLTVQPLSHVAMSFDRFAILPYAPRSLSCDIDSAAQQLPAHWPSSEPRICAFPNLSSASLHFSTSCAAKIRQYQ